jgi:hypothetical protein
MMIHQFLNLDSRYDPVPRSDEQATDETENITLIKSSGMEELPFVKRLFTTTGLFSRWNLSPALLHVAEFRDELGGKNSLDSH